MAASAAARSELKERMFDESSRKHSKGEGSSLSNASFSKMKQCIKLLDELTSLLPEEVYNKASTHFINENMHVLVLSLGSQTGLDPGLS